MRRSLAIASSVMALFAVGVGDALSRGAAGRTVLVDVPMPALAGNLLGTSDVQSAAVYLPPSYDREPERRFPVVYLLHGIFDSHETWTEHTDVPAILDRLIAGGGIDETIVVMPDGGNRYGGGFYRNSPSAGVGATPSRTIWSASLTGGSARGPKRMAGRSSATPWAATGLCIWP